MDKQHSNIITNSEVLNCVLFRYSETGNKPKGCTNAQLHKMSRLTVSSASDTVLILRYGIRASLFGKNIKGQFNRKNNLQFEGNLQ